MTILFAGAEKDAFILTGTILTEETTAGFFDSAYARAAIRIYWDGSSTLHVATPVFASQSSLWLHLDMGVNSVSSFTGKGINFLDNTGTPVFRIQGESTGNLRAYYWNGSAFVAIGSAFSIANNILYNIDVQLIGGASGSYKLYMNGTLLGSGSASMTSVVNLSQVRFEGLGSNNYVFISQVIVATVPTISWKMFSRFPTGAGGSSAWTGAYTDVDELVLDDGDFITSATANNVSTFFSSSITVPGGFEVKGVAVTGRVKLGSTGPQNLQAVVEVAGTNYFGSNVPGLGLGYAPFSTVWETNPATAAIWTSAAAGSASLGFGIKSIT